MQVDYELELRPRTDRWGKVRFYDSPGRPRKREMKLASWLDQKGKSRKQFAEEAGLSVGYVHKLCRGERAPSRDLIALIEKLTENEVTFQDWINPS